jgi:hypothetical protein
MWIMQLFSNSQKPLNNPQHIGWQKNKWSGENKQCNESKKTYTQNEKKIVSKKIFLKTFFFLENLIKLEEESMKFFILRPTQKLWCKKY